MSLIQFAFQKIDARNTAFYKRQLHSFRQEFESRLEKFYAALNLTIFINCSEI